MIRFRHAVVLLASFAGAAGAFERLHAAPNLSATTKLVSDHVFRGQRFGGASLQPSLDLSAGDLFAGISSNVPIENRASNQPGTELDVYSFYRLELGAKTHLTPGIAAYFYRHAPVSSGYRRTVVEPGLALSHTFAAVRLTSTASYDLNRRGPVIDLTADVAFPLTTLGTEVDLAASVGGYRLRDASAPGAANTRVDGNYWSVAATVPYQITVGSKILVGVTYAAAFDSEIRSGSILRRNPLATRRVVAQLGYSYSF